MFEHVINNTCAHFLQEQEPIVLGRGGGPSTKTIYNKSRSYNCDKDIRGSNNQVGAVHYLKVNFAIFFFKHYLARFLVTVTR